MLINRLIKRQTYSIPDSLSHSSGVITAQFGTVSYNVNLSGLSANTLYFIYLSGSTPTLSYSITVPSAFRASNPDAMLVGAFYANGDSSVAFGVFVNIEGVPETELWSAGTISVSSTGGGVAKGGGQFVDTVYTRRSGNRIYQEYQYRQTTAGSAGSGQYLIAIPGFVIDTAKVQPNTGGFIGLNGNGLTFSTLGYGEITDSASVNSKMLFQAYTGGTSFRAWLHGADTTTNPAYIGGWGPNFSQFSIANLTWSGKIDFPAVGLTNTPLKDL